MELTAAAAAAAAAAEAADAAAAAAAQAAEVGSPQRLLTGSFKTFANPHFLSYM